MRKIMLPLLLALAGTLLPYPAFAQRVASSEDRDNIRMAIECGCLVKVEVSNNTMAYYAVGDTGDRQAIEDRTDTTATTKLKSQLYTLGLVGFTTGELVKFLFEKFWHASLDARYDEADTLFAEIQALLKDSVFPTTDEWPYNKTDYNLRKVVEELSHTSSLGPRYGKPTIELLETLLNKYPENQLLFESVRDSIKGRIGLKYSVFENQRPTAEEQKIFLPKLLELYIKHPHAYMSFINEDIEEYQKIIPEVAQELQRLRLIREKY